MLRARRTLAIGALLVLAPRLGAQAPQRPDTIEIRRLANALADDSMRGRGPWSEDATSAARFIARQLTSMGARPAIGSTPLVPFVDPSHPRDTVYNVIAYLPPRRGSTDSSLVGITAHLDHLGAGAPDATGDSIYNGFLDDAIGVAMVLEVAERSSRHPGERGLLIMVFNLEEQGLLGSQALLRDPLARAVLRRLSLVVGVDAGSPAGEALDWELMGAQPTHPAALLADSLARAHGWTTRATAARGISDVYPFARAGIPILFPIPGPDWRGNTRAGRDSAMAKFDHYHQPADAPRADYPMVGTWYFAEWLWEVVQGAANSPQGQH